jgi:hypothetical protein
VASLSFVALPENPTDPKRRHWSSVQILYLTRLSRLLHLEVEWRERVPKQDWRVRLIHKAIYSTYCDCLAEEVGDDARSLMRHGKAGTN